MFSLDIANVQLLSTYYFCLASILIFHCVLPDCSVSEPGWLSILLSIAPFLQISNGKKSFWLWQKIVLKSQPAKLILGMILSPKGVYIFLQIIVNIYLTLQCRYHLIFKIAL